MDETDKQIEKRFDCLELHFDSFKKPSEGGKYRN